LFELNKLLDPKTNALERAHLIQIALAAEKYTKQGLAKKINKSSSYISNHLRLLQLPDIIKEALISETISEGHARAISFLEDQSDMERVYEDILKFNYSVRQVEKEVDKLRQHKQAYGKVASEIKDNVLRIGAKLQAETKVTRRDQKIVVSLYLPLGFIAHQKVKKILTALQILEEKEINN
jgi:ParB family chromosome partitioning protein